MLDVTENQKSKIEFLKSEQKTCLNYFEDKCPPKSKFAHCYIGTNGDTKKPKHKAYRRSDSGTGNRSRSTTKELALPPDDSLMCPPSFLTGLKPDLELQDGSRMELKVAVKVHKSLSKVEK